MSAFKAARYFSSLLSSSRRYFAPTNASAFFFSAFSETALSTARRASDEPLTAMCKRSKQPEFCAKNILSCSAGSLAASEALSLIFGCALSALSSFLSTKRAGPPCRMCGCLSSLGACGTYSSFAISAIASKQALRCSSSTLRLNGCSLSANVETGA